jgi:hypothetical protein
MKKLLLIPVLILASCYNVERNCKDFKTGKFRFDYEVMVYKNNYFERNDSLEIETYDGKTDTASIRWVNDCEYILKNYIQKNMAEEKGNRYEIFARKRTKTYFLVTVGMDPSKI